MTNNRAPFYGAKSLGVRTPQNPVFQLNVSISDASRQPQFAGIDFDKYFNRMLKLSALFWGGLALAGIGYPVADHFKTSQEVTHLRHLDQQKEASDANIQASLKQLQMTPEGDRSKALEAHQQLLQQEVLKQLDMMKSIIDATTVLPAVKDALAESRLSAEEQKAVVRLFVSNQDGEFLSPEAAFNQFADQILSQHAPVETVKQAKQSMRNLVAQGSRDQLVGNLTLGVAILGALASAGLLGYGAVKGTNDLFPMVAWAPMMGLAFLSDGVRKLRDKK